MRFYYKVFSLIVLLSLSTTPVQADVFVSKISSLSSSAKNAMLQHGLYQESCPLHLERLSAVTFSYYDFSGVRHDDGSLVVMDTVAPNVELIMHELYKLKFPIQQSRAMEYYAGNDDLSMDANNSSAFNCREVTNKSGVFSIHSYGLAIDINPIQNPYLGKFDYVNGKVSVSPSNGIYYLNRANLRPGMVETVVAIFRQHGFSVWGGDWDDRIDFQHFQTSRVTAKLLASMSVSDAKIFFASYSKNPQFFNSIAEDNEDYINQYKKSPLKFMQLLQDDLLH